ncbi:hypothetical protein [uncultured Desulfobacter sp.]|uniref:hypothetical protein n=1 Tax=uncultured Desulfobacter sp. TaxID=240139 RepID=UPI0029C664BA|nr:hypothetical protein [uncultured Desulfobacter sp.]
MIRAILNINTIMLMFLILILLADYAAFFGINPSFAPQPLFSGQIIEGHLGNGAIKHVDKNKSILRK